MAFITCPECNQNISEKAKVCVHCGYPIVEEKKQEIEFPTYRLKSTGDSSCVIAALLRILTWILVIGGIITSIVVATEAGFLGFLICAVAFALYAVITGGLSTLAEEIHNTHAMVQSLELVKVEKKDEKKPVAGRAAPSIVGSKRCPHCDARNAAGTMFCKSCGRGMV